MDLSMPGCEDTTVQFPKDTLTYFVDVVEDLNSIFYMIGKTFFVEIILFTIYHRNDRRWSKVENPP